MSEISENVNERGDRVERYLRQVLKRVPFISTIELFRSVLKPGNPELLIKLEIRGQSRDLLCSFTDGKPRNVRMAALSLVQRLRHDQAGVIVAPFLSEQAQEICVEAGTGFVDLEGNIRLVFDTVFIEHEAPPKARTQRRALRSIFSPKSTEIIRILMQDPSRSWRVADLAEAARASLGHVSNVRRRLIDEEWAEVTAEGLRLTQPSRLLQSWRAAYKSLAGERLAFRTALHGTDLQEALKKALRAANDQGAAMLAGYSAAQWLTPYLDVATHSSTADAGKLVLYADAPGLEFLERHLQLTAVARGENVIIVRPADNRIFREKVEVAPGILCTGAIQTYLDLSAPWVTSGREEEERQS